MWRIAVRDFGDVIQSRLIPMRQQRLDESPRGFAPRGLRIVTVARDGYSSIVAGGIVVAFLFQVFVNVGMTMGIAPITGIPLPFVSVGGSSMIANLIAIGILLSISVRSRGRR